VPEQYQPKTYIGIDIRGAGLVIFFIFTVIVGWMAKGLIGRSLIHWAERIVDRMPVVRSLYNGLKQIAETVFSQTDTSFERACMVEYPRRGIFSLAFVTGDGLSQITAENGEQLMTVFVPSSPTPITGYTVFIRRSEVISLNLSVDEAIKLVVSAGVIVPDREKLHALDSLGEDEGEAAPAPEKHALEG